MNTELFKKEYQIFKETSSNQFLLLYSSFEDQIIFLSKVCKETDGQTLISCASISEIEHVSQILKKYIPSSQIEVIHKNFSKTQLLQKNKNINSSKIKVILSTKTGIFSPFFNLKNIIIINEEEKDHKQYDLNPRYNIKDICAFISQKYNVKLILTSISPLVKTYYQNYKTLNIQEKNTFTTINFVNQKVERKSQNELYISTKLQEKISETLAKNKNIIIINNNLKSEFKSNQKIKEEIESVFKNIKTLTVDSKTPVKDSDFINAKIIIGTEFFVKNYLYKAKNIGLVALLSIDNFINSTKIESNENLFSYISYFLNITNEKKIENLLIQTKNIDNKTLNLAINQDYFEFYKEEIKIRKILNFPPFSLLVDLIIKEKTEELLQEKKAKIQQFLDNNHIEVIGEEVIEKELKTKSRKQENITIKLDYTDNTLSNSQKTLLKQLSELCLLNIK